MSDTDDPTTRLVGRLVSDPEFDLASHITEQMQRRDEEIWQARLDRAISAGRLPASTTVDSLTSKQLRKLERTYPDG